jgi:beta-1,4-mannosyltransferase
MTSPTLEAPGLPRSALGGPRRCRLASFPPILKTNPYQRLLYARLAEHGFEVETAGEFRIRWLRRNRARVDLLHFHWPQGFWHVSSRRALRGSVADSVYLALFAARLAAAKVLGYHIAWTVHQVYPHDRPGPTRIDQFGTRLLARAADVLLAHDEATAAHARRELGRFAQAVAVVPHGSYTGVYVGRRSPEETRRELGLKPDRLVFLHLGDLRGYKDIERLLEAFRDAQLPPATLVVAGSPGDRESARAVEHASRRDARIVPHLTFVPEEQVAELYEAADVAVLARSDGGTSGSLILALSMGKPVVAADRPAYRDLVGDEAGWLFDPGRPGSLQAALERAGRASADERRSKGTAASVRAERLDWGEIGRETARILFAATARVGT